jgi:hypothetical protein
MGVRLVSRADPGSASVASSPNRSVEGGWKILSVRIDNQTKFFDLRLDETPVACQERVALRPRKGPDTKEENRFGVRYIACRQTVHVVFARA